MNEVIVHKLVDTKRPQRDHKETTKRPQRDPHGVYIYNPIHGTMNIDNILTSLEQ